MPMPRNSLKSILARGIRTETGCLLWPGALAKDGRYGTVSYLDRTHRVHKLVYELGKGEWLPDGINVLHSCDTPLCIEPSHLFEGTTADNVADKVRKNRQAAGELCNHPHRILSEEDIPWIRDNYAAGVSVFELANKLTCSKSAIYYVLNRRTWKHVP